MTKSAKRLLALAMAESDGVKRGGSGAFRLSMIGLSKNAGKTFTLNQIIRAAAERQVPVGLVSTGRDGEAQDAITELPKPRIDAPAGAWIATAKGALEASTAEVSLLQELPIQTPFGPMLIGQVTRAGQLLLIGPGSARRTADLLGGLEAHGAKLLLVDGSFDRMAAASPTVTGQVVLAAGAAYSQSMTETVAQVRHLLDRFDTPVAGPNVASLAAEAMLAAPVSLVTGDGQITPIPVATSLGDPMLIVGTAMRQVAVGERGTEAIAPALVLSGALSDPLLQTLVSNRAMQIRVVVPDPTHILVDRNRWRQWQGLGGQVAVLRSVRMLAVTTNPHSPVGKEYEASAFFEAVSAVAHRPVFDLRAGLSAWNGGERIEPRS